MSDAPAVSYTLTDEPPRSVTTGAAEDKTLASPVESSNRDAWQTVIDAKLIEWGRDPEQLADEDLIPPTRDSVKKAIRIAQVFRDDNVPPPLAVVPDGDGGIVLERWDDSLTVSIEINAQGATEFVECRQGRVTLREQFYVES